MKYLLVALLLPLGSFGQRVKCDSGYSYFPSIGTSSLQININDCVPDSVYKKLWLMFAENMCGESGFGMGSDSFMMASGGNWINDSCEHYEYYKRRVDTGWLEITECEYYYLNNSCYSMSTDDTIKKACCGHLPHTFNPADTLGYAESKRLKTVSEIKLKHKNMQAGKKAINSVWVCLLFLTIPVTIISNQIKNTNNHP